MNRSSFSKLIALTAFAAFFSSTAHINSQGAPVAGQKSAQESLTALKAANAELLQKQQKTLQKLDELKQLAEQLRIMAKRS